MSDDDLRRETENMQDYYLGNGKRQKDWVATWRKWMRSQYRKPGVRAPFKDPLDEHPPDCVHRYRDLIRMSDEGQYLPERYKEFVRAYKASH